MEIKKKKCKECQVEFTPYKTTQTVCSFNCNLKQKHAKETKAEAESKRRNPELFKAARIVFNEYIRERDKGKPCICCGRPLGKNYQAGHYYSGGGHANVIFNEDNVHAQRFECNNMKSGNNVEYGVRLEKMIGKDAFEILRAQAYEVKKYTPDELVRIIQHYKKQTLCLREEKK